MYNVFMNKEEKKAKAEEKAWDELYKRSTTCYHPKPEKWIDRHPFLTGLLQMVILFALAIACITLLSECSELR